MRIDENKEYTLWRNNTLIAKMETDKKYLILKMGHFLISTAGLGWYILYVLQGIRFAIENNFIPVVDWKHSKLPQYDAAKVGKDNVWEYFFEQPFGISVEQAYASGDFFVIDDVNMLNYPKMLDFGNLMDFYDTDNIEWRRYFQQYIRLNEKVKRLFERYMKEQIPDTENLIGVLARGTDYKELKPVGHLRPIAINELFEQIDEHQSNRGIFLATEDSSILKAFENRYPGYVYSVNAKRYDQVGHDTLNVIYKEENGLERDLKYLYSLYTISKCAIGIYSACGGGALASLMRKDVGIYYKYLCHGYNRAKGVIIGSYVEKEQNHLLLIGKKPIMFYALNTLKLLAVEEVDILVTDKIKRDYQEYIGLGKEFGMRINYIVSDTYNFAAYIASNLKTIESSRLILLYADYFVHGKDVIKELSEKVNTFDGAYVWGTKTYFSDNQESIQIDVERNIPKAAFTFYKPENFSLMGRFIFDYELKKIVSEIIRENENITLVDVLNVYINRRKLFFLEYKRGIFYSKIDNIESLEKADQIVNLIEDIQKQKIGDFEAFRN